MNKSTIEEIRERFDKDVERFSNLETGQVTTIDAKLCLELIAEAANRINPKAKTLLDIGCGAGNYTLKMLQKNPDLHCSLLDLSKPMLEKAEERVKEISKNPIMTFHGDFRDAKIEDNYYDIILAGAVMHHLREEEDWERTFEKIFRILKKGGCFMVSDFIAQDNSLIHEYTMEQYGDYLEGLAGKEYRKTVLDYVEREDSPRSILYQLDLMKKVGFSQVEILHKNVCFGAFGGIK